MYHYRELWDLKNGKIDNTFSVACWLIANDIKYNFKLNLYSDNIIYLYGVLLMGLKRSNQLHQLKKIMPIIHRDENSIDCSIQMSTRISRHMMDVCM